MSTQQDWENLGEYQRFHKLPLYPLSWDVRPEDFSRGLVFPGPFAGPVCVLGSEDSKDMRLKVTLYSQTGNLIEDGFIPQIFTNKTERLVRGGAGWTVDGSDIFVLVTKSGVVSLIEASTMRQASINLGLTSTTTTTSRDRADIPVLVMAHVAFNHVVALASDGGVFIVRDVRQVFANFSTAQRLPSIERIRPSSLIPKPYSGFFSFDSDATSSSFYCVLAMCFVPLPEDDHRIVLLTSHADGTVSIAELESVKEEEEDAQANILFSRQQQQHQVKRLTPSRRLNPTSHGPFYRVSVNPFVKSDNNRISLNGLIMSNRGGVDQPLNDDGTEEETEQAFSPSKPQSLLLLTFALANQRGDVFLLRVDVNSLATIVSARSSEEGHINERVRQQQQPFSFEPLMLVPPDDPSELGCPSQICFFDSNQLVSVEENHHNSKTPKSIYVVACSYPSQGVLLVVQKHFPSFISLLSKNKKREIMDSRVNVSTTTTTTSTREKEILGRSKTQMMMKGSFEAENDLLLQKQFQGNTSQEYEKEEEAEDDERMDWIRYDFTVQPGLALVQELDGIRIYTSQSHEMLTPVPQCVLNTLQFGSAAPSAVLLDAIETADSKSSEAIRELRLEKQLLPAIIDCIHSGLEVFDMEDQRRLLQVASKGKVYLHDGRDRKLAARLFAKACETLRVLNIVREAKVGMPLTLRQFVKQGGMLGLCFRLARWNFYYLAQKILRECSLYVSEPKRIRALDRIKLLWARQVIRANHANSHWSSGNAAMLILDQINTNRLRHGWHLLAKCAMILHITSLKDCTEQDLTMLATKSATTTNPRDDHVGYGYKAKNMVVGTIVGATSRLESLNPFAASTTDSVQISKKEEHEDAKNPFDAPFDGPQGQLALKLLEREPNYLKRVARLVELSAIDEALKVCKDNHDVELEAYVLASTQSGGALKTVPVNSFSRPFLERMNKDEKSFRERLASYQQQLQQSVSLLNTRPTRSLAELCCMLVASNDEQEASKLAKEYQMSDLGLWIAKVRALIGKREWKKVEELAKLRKHKCGVIVDACIQLGYPQEAMRFVWMIPNEEEQLECLVNLGEYAKAIELIRSKGFPVHSRDWSIAMLRANISVDVRLSDLERDRLLHVLH